MKELDMSTAIELCSPYPYTLVVTAGMNEKPNIMGVAWWTFTCMRPLMIAISVGHGRYTHDCLQACNEFVLCFPSKEQARGAWLCGSKSGRNMDKAAEAGFQMIPSKVVRPPVIDGATAAYECKVIEQVECGDHTLYIGEVVAIHGNTDRSGHLYSVHYRKLVSIDCQGNTDFGLEYK